MQRLIPSLPEKKKPWRIADGVHGSLSGERMHMKYGMQALVQRWTPGHHQSENKSHHEA
jgi:hypothetical protein